MLQLSWTDKLVDNIKTIFVQLYGDQLTKPNTTQVECRNFDQYFDQQLQELERLDTKSPAKLLPAHATNEKDAISGKQGDDPPSPRDALSVDSTPVTSRPSTPANNGAIASDTSPAAKLSRRARKAVNRTNSAQASGDETARKSKGAKQGKKARKWDDDGMPTEEDESVQLDYSGAGADEPAVGRSSGLEEVDASTWGSTTKGKFVLKDLGDEVHSMLAEAEAQKATTKTESSGSSGGLVGSGLSAVSGLFRNFVGGKTLTKEDLDKAMKGMEEHLLRKNVAREAAVRLCEGVEKELIGVTTGSFESINTRIQKAMEASLTKMLTPTSSLDLLREIDSVTSPSATSMRKARPYVMSIVGVNGVGKSTNLSKICFFLLQNKYKVLIAAGDTFRSGAVEQLAVHVRNLKEMTSREGGEVELYQKGYGKDAATVARDAVQYAAQQGFNVVLIDTAGRRHNDQRLMSSLEKFAKFAQPDKILMVGEVSPPMTHRSCKTNPDTFHTRLSLAQILSPKPATSTPPSAPCALSTASSSPSAIPSEIWLAHWSVSSTRPMCPSCSSASVSTTQTYGTSPSNGLSKSCLAITNFRFDYTVSSEPKQYLFFDSSLLFHLGQSPSVIPPV